MSWTWRNRGAVIDSPVARVSGSAAKATLGSGGPGELLGSGFLEMGTGQTTYNSAIKINPSAKLAVIIVHLERCSAAVTINSVSIGATALTVSSTIAPAANRDVVAIAYGVIDPSETDITVNASGANQACLYTSYFFSDATTVPEFTLQDGGGTTTPGMVVTFPWNPTPNKQLYMNFHTGRVNPNQSPPEMDIPNGNFVYAQEYIPPYGGARNAGPAYTMFKGNSESTETNQFALTYETDGAYDHTFCQFRVE